MTYPYSRPGFVGSWVTGFENCRCLDGLYYLLSNVRLCPISLCQKVVPPLPAPAESRWPGAILSLAPLRDGSRKVNAPILLIKILRKE